MIGVRPEVYPNCVMGRPPQPVRAKNRLYATATRYLITMIILVVEAGCGTLLTPVKQSIRVESNVDSAAVFLNDELVGKTPITVRVSHRRSHTIAVRYGDQLEFCLLKSRTNWLPLIADVLLIPVGAFTSLFLAGVSAIGGGPDPGGIVLIPVAIPVAILMLEATTGQLRVVRKNPCVVEFRQP